jgi:hypothetical protein
VNRLALSVLAATAAAGLLAGCTSKEPGDATPTPGTGGNTQTETTSPASSGDAAPPVTGPELSLDKFKSDACTLLSAEQIAKLGDMRPGRKSDRQGQAQCLWEPTSSSSGVPFTYTISKQTLDDYYKGKDNYPVFNPTEVAGYPAASFDGTDAKHGACTTVVALGKTTALMVQVNVRGTSTPNYTTPCVESERGAAVAVEGLK